MSIARCHGVAHYLVHIWDSLVKLQGGWSCFISLRCFRTVMQFFGAVCMQAMTHSMDKASSQLVIVGRCFVAQCWFFWETRCNEKWAVLGQWLCNR